VDKVVTSLKVRRVLFLSEWKLQTIETCGLSLIRQARFYGLRFIDVIHAICFPFLGKISIKNSYQLSFEIQNFKV
jgi:hypothetical protein